MDAIRIRKMAGIGLMAALVAVLQFLGSIIPPIGGFPITLVLLPVVLGGALYGIGGGALLGGAFGVLVYINCVTGADPGGAMVFQADPLLCFAVVLGKGVLAGAASSTVYRLLSGWNAYIAMALAAIVCPVVNTGVFLACMLLFFADVLNTWAQGGDLVGYILSGLVLINFVPELIINLLFSPVSARVIQTVRK